MKLWLIVLIGIIVLIHALPLLVMLLLVWRKRQGEKMPGRPILSDVLLILMGILAELLAFVGFHKYYWGYGNFFYTLQSVYLSHIYANDIIYFAISAALCLLVSLLSGLLFRQRKILLSPLRKNLLLVLLSFVGVVISVLFYYGTSAPSRIVINEICSNNQSVYIDDIFSTNDYVELYNPCAFPCRLDSLWLSDDSENLQKLELKGYEIGAGAYQVVRLTNDADSFSIDKNGETVYLSNEWGKINDEVHCGEMRANTAFCRMPDGSDVWGIFTCSPWESNNAAISAEVVVQEPSFSHESGFYEETFELELYSEQNTEIYYTLDGSIPDTSSARYTEPVRVYDRSNEQNTFKSITNVVPDYGSYAGVETPVDKAFIITAVAVDAAGISSGPVTRTYFVDLDKYKDKNVISLVAEPEKLFGNNGIYVTGEEYDQWYRSGKDTDAPLANFEKYGREWEAPATIQFIGKSFNLEQRVGVRIMGGSARLTPFKRLSVFARKDYSGSKWIQVPLADHKEVHSFMLREGFANAYFPSIMENRDVSIQDMAPVTVFINGEYWYDTYLLEKYNEEYFSQRYQVDEDNVILYKNGNLEAGTEADTELYDAIYQHVEMNNLSDEAAYREFCDVVDIQSYIDFWCFHIYINNLDIEENKNAVLWRTRTAEDDLYGDGRWRWALYDLDAAEWEDTEEYGVDDRAKINTFTQDTKFAGAAFNKRPIYSALKKNDDFCRQFVVTFMDLINTNFSVDHMTELLEEWGSDITWYDSYFAKRADYIVPYMAEEFELTGTLEPVTLSVNDSAAGEILLNSISPDLSEGEWKGYYYTDYPVILTAIPKAGYRFAGWSGDVESSDACVETEVNLGGIQLNAVFEKAE